MPASISPQGKRAAQQIRTLFAWIVVANLAFVAFVMWPRTKKTDSGTAKDPIAQMERVLDRTVAAYNAEDSAAFLAEFSSTANPRADSAFFSGTVQGIYRRDMGKVTSKTLVPAVTAATATGGMLVCDLQCEKRPHARLVAKFVREADTMELAEWRIESQ